MVCTYNAVANAICNYTQVHYAALSYNRSFTWTRWWSGRASWLALDSTCLPHQSSAPWLIAWWVPLFKRHCVHCAPLQFWWRNCVIVVVFGQPLTACLLFVMCFFFICQSNFKVLVIMICGFIINSIGFALLGPAPFLPLPKLVTLRSLSIFTTIRLSIF